MKRFVSWCLTIVLLASCFSFLPINTLAYSPAYAIPNLTGNKATDVANIASSQLGYTGANGTIYGAWWNGVTNWGVDYTYSGWCAMFACWCADKAGAGLYIAYNKNGASPSLLLDWYKSSATYDTSFAKAPTKGDFIFFGSSNGYAEHVAVVTGYDSSSKTVSFVGGNQGSAAGGTVTKSSCKYQRGITWGSQYVIGFGRPNYGGSSGNESALTISGANSPGNLTEGDVFSVSGSISSGSPITSVTVGVYDMNGNFKTGIYNANPNSTFYDIKASADAVVYFNNLSPGTYRYIVSAKNQAGASKEFINTVFEVQSKKPMLSVEKTVNCKRTLQLPNRVVDLFATPEATERTTYYDYGPKVTSYQYCAMSDGTIRYKVGVNHNGKDMDMWLVYSDDIVATKIHTQTTTNYESEHPHKVYSVCECGEKMYTGARQYVQSCATCNPTGENIVQVTIDKSTYKFNKTTGTIIKCSTGVEGTLSIPSYIDGVKVTAIGDSAFYPCRCSGYIIPEGVTRIGKYAFRNNSPADLETVTIPSTVVTIEEGVFTGCDALKTIKIASNNPAYVVRDNVLYSKDMRELLYCCPASHNGVFQIPDGVQSVADRALYDCTSLTEIVLSKDVSTLPSNMCSVFPGCKVSAVQENPRYTSTGTNGILYTKDMKTVVYCPRTKNGTVDIPEGVERIQSGAFAWCYSITELSLPRSLKMIEWDGILVSTTNVSTNTTDCNLKKIVIKSYDCRIDYSFGKALGAPGITNVYGYSGSNVESYANNYGYTFVPISCTEFGHNWDDGRITTTPTCTKPGVKTYTCKSCSQTKNEVVAAIGHDDTLATYNAKEPTCAMAGYTGDKVCSRCGEVIQRGETIPAIGHHWDNGEIVREPSETNTGEKRFICVECGVTKTEAIPTVAHVHTITAVAKIAATCTKDGTEAYWKCSGCGKLFSDAQGKTEINAPVVIKATGHKWDSGKVAKEPTETAEGVKTFTCTVCGETRTETIPALGHIHTLTAVPKVNATCTKDGTEAYWKCSGCGKLFSDAQGKNEISAPVVIKAVGHKWDSGKVTKEPTETAEGVKTFTCTVCGETRTEAIPKLSPVTPPAPTNPFVDVKQGQYYYDPVLWAVNHQPQITNGTSATTFSPDATCTRGQVVTFLWRANGCLEPKSTSNPFKDVASGAYYYKAVLWAVENGITNGTSTTTFSPNAPCTRAHVVTFLWRSANKPVAGDANPFKDVKAGQYYTDAVFWAVSKNITNGTSATSFSPDSPCTRGQIVTFLYRYMGKN